MFAIYVFMCIVYMDMATAQTNATDRKMVNLPVEAHRRLKFIADTERRTIAAQLDVLIDEALRARGLDPETLQPVQQEASHAS